MLHVIQLSSVTASLYFNNFEINGGIEDGEGGVKFPKAFNLQIEGKLR